MLRERGRGKGGGYPLEFNPIRKERSFEVCAMVRLIETEKRFFRKKTPCRWVYSQLWANAIGLSAGLRHLRRGGVRRAEKESSHATSREKKPDEISYEGGFLALACEKGRDKKKTPLACGQHRHAGKTQNKGRGERTASLWSELGEKISKSRESVPELPIRVSVEGPRRSK